MAYYRKTPRLEQGKSTHTATRRELYKRLRLSPGNRTFEVAWICMNDGCANHGGMITTSHVAPRRLKARPAFARQVRESQPVCPWCQHRIKFLGFLPETEYLSELQTQASQN
jgi:hypothetical protein